jgi:hypothetical protein
MRRSVAQRFGRRRQAGAARSHRLKNSVGQFKTTVTGTSTRLPSPADAKRNRLPSLLTAYPARDAPDGRKSMRGSPISGEDVPLAVDTAII